MITRRLKQLMIGSALAVAATTVHAQNAGQTSTDDPLKYTMKTRWADKVDPAKVWSEYPRPQMTRENFTNLNGHWQYAILPKENARPATYQGNILVPFAVESQLSGVKKMVGEKNYLWYSRNFTAPRLAKNEHLLLHFGAVDWEAQVFVNGREAGIHQGGYDAFYFDITPLLKPGEQEVVVRVWDPSDKGTQARGKQVSEPQGIWYTPVTGIWQTVWLEKVPASHIANVKSIPDIDRRTLTVSVTTESAPGMSVKVIALRDRQPVAEQTAVVAAGETTLTLAIPQPRLWSPDDPFLYDLTVELVGKGSKPADRVGSYFGMRKTSLGKDAKGYTRMMLNNKPLFQFGLLDQGWWPDGLYTPASEEAMMFDVVKTKEMGFNMLRKHVKVECARYYYQCDKIGMLVWQDMPNGNYFRELRIEPWAKEDANRPEESAKQFELELKRLMDQHMSYPSIVVWVPFNEGWGQYDTKRVTQWVDEYDQSRLVDSPSGWTDRGVGDVIDAHIYPGPGMEEAEKNRASVLGEFGGLGYPMPGHLWWDKRNWGYITYDNKDKFAGDFEILLDGLKGPISRGLSAAIYTQTTDVEGEINGLITYDREVTKIEPSKLKAMIDPLYDDYWAPYFLVRDGEAEPVSWKTSATLAANWNTMAFDGFQWATLSTPASTFDNPAMAGAAKWNGEPMYLRREFDVNTTTGSLYLSHSLQGVKVTVYLNGELLWEHEEKGGRKRHYTNIDVSHGKKFLTNGKNVLAVAVIKVSENASFDMGLYTSAPVGKPSESNSN